MRSLLLLVLAALVAMGLWAGLVFWGTLNGWTRTALAPAGDAPAFIAAAEREIASKHPGNAAFRLLENGKLAGEYFIGDSVDRDTLFQVASLSKWLTAWGVMTLVDAGRLDLDAPVASYLKRWSGRGVLKPETVKLMRQPHAAQFGADIWGLGTLPYVPNGAGDFVIGHDGKRSPAINATARIDPSTGDGIVLLESGHPLLATLVGRPPSSPKTCSRSSCGRPDGAEMILQRRPVIRQDFQNRQPATSQVLLMTKVFICDYEEGELRALRSFQQRAILDSRPALFLDGDGVCPGNA